MARKENRRSLGVRARTDPSLVAAALAEALRPRTTLRERIAEVMADGKVRTVVEIARAIGRGVSTTKPEADAMVRAGELASGETERVSESGKRVYPTAYQMPGRAKRKGKR